METIYLLSCTKKKQTYPCSAEEMYKPSALYRLSLQYAMNRVSNKEKQIYILSAKYGLLSLGDRIESYNVTLKSMSAAEILDWGKRVYQQLKNQRTLADCHFVFLTGTAYSTPLIKYLPSYTLPLKGMPLGMRLQWLKEHQHKDATFNIPEKKYDRIKVATNINPTNSSTKEAVKQQAIYSKEKETPNSSQKEKKALPTSTDFESCLNDWLDNEKKKGNSEAIICSGDLHRVVGGYPGPNHRMPVCCDVMYKKMKTGDEIVHKPPKGKGASLKIRYVLGNERNISFKPIKGRSLFYLDEKEHQGDAQVKNGESNKTVLTPAPAHGDAEQEGVFVFAKNLREKAALNCVPGNLPGWYTWWGPIQAVRALLASPHLTREYSSDILPLLNKKKIKDMEYYALYVGIAVKESIRARLHWHINQPHTESCVKHGTLSTLRQSISSLLAANQYDEKSTNGLIDLLVVEYFTLDLPIKSMEAKTKIEAIERSQMEKFLYPLNIKENKQQIIQAFLKELKSLRRRGKGSYRYKR